MSEAFILCAIIYPLVGVSILVYDIHACEDCRDDLVKHRWPLVAMMAAFWPVFVWQCLRERL